MQALNEIIEKLVKNGIQVTMTYNEVKDCVIYDLNTGMKSHCHLMWDNGANSVVAYMRYDESRYVDDYSDVLWAVKSCLQGRDYMSSAWESLLLKEGLLTKTVVQSVTYS